jgi:hypothetical protein
MSIPVRDPRWKTGAAAAEMDALANDVKNAAANLKGLMRRAGVLQESLEAQMGGSISGLSKLMRPMRTLEQASEKLDTASWTFEEFARDLHKWTL